MFYNTERWLFCGLSKKGLDRVLLSRRGNDAVRFWELERDLLLEPFNRFDISVNEKYLLRGNLEDVIEDGIAR